MIDIRSASIEAILQEVGDQLKKHIKQQGTVSEFIDKSGVPSTTLYRFLDGGNIGLDNFIRIVRTLDRVDVLLTLMKEPEVSPIDSWRSKMSKPKSGGIKAAVTSHRNKM